MKTVEILHAQYNLCRTIEEYKEYECLVCDATVPIRRTTTEYQHSWGDPMVDWDSHRWYVTCMHCRYFNWLEPEEELVP